jgi:hypothetical protein
MCCVPMPCQTPRLDTHRVSEVPHVPETAGGSGSAGAPELHACQASPIHLHIAVSFLLLAAFCAAYAPATAWLHHQHLGLVTAAASHRVRVATALNHTLTALPALPCLLCRHELSCRPAADLPAQRG